MKEITITWVEEAEYWVTVEVPNNFNIDDWSAADALLSGVEPDEAYSRGRTIESVEEEV